MKDLLKKVAAEALSKADSPLCRITITMDFGHAEPDEDNEGEGYEEEGEDDDKEVPPSKATKAKK